MFEHTSVRNNSEYKNTLHTYIHVQMMSMYIMNTKHLQVNVPPEQLNHLAQRSTKLSQYVYIHRNDTLAFRSLHLDGNRFTCLEVSFVYLCMCACVYVCICVCIYVYTYIQTYIHTYKHTYICICICIYIYESHRLPNSHMIHYSHSIYLITTRCPIITAVTIHPIVTVFT